MENDLRSRQPRFTEEMSMGRAWSFRAAGVSAVAGISLTLLVLPPATASAAAVGPTSDFNADGRTDLAIGIPKALIGTNTGAGAISVVPGSVGAPDGSARATISQSSPGVPGGSEPADGFGSELAYGDINGDGYADLAVSSPGEDLGPVSDAGALTLFYGSATGLTPDGTHYARPASARASGDRCGETLTIGDFNADGSADVLAFCPGSFALWWIDGATRTVRNAAPQSAGYSARTVSSVDGPSAASGDVNADGYTDALLAFTQLDGTRPLFVLHGSAEGISTARSTTLPGGGGASLATGDIDGDGTTDVAVGRPQQANGGALTAYYGSPSGITVGNSTTIEQSTADVPGGDEAGDALGASISVGDLDADGHADVMAGLPGEDLTLDGTAHADTGTVLLLHGSTSGLTSTGSDTIHTDETGISGAAEAGDRLGSAASLGDFNGDGYADLGIGSDGENAGDGTVLTINWSATGLDTASTQYLGPGDLGVSPTSHIGRVLAP
jgi:hypothetical protein